MIKDLGSVMICSMMQLTLLSFFILTSNQVISETVIYESTITVDTIWDTGNSPYILEGNVTVTEGVNLTIEAGCEVRFNGYYGLFIEGQLNAEGTSSDMIKFTSNRSIPAMNDWRGILINAKGNAVIKYCNLTYSEFAVYLNESSENHIQGNKISDNYDGIYLYRSSNNTVFDNDISDSLQYGLFLSRSSHNDIMNNNLSNNWEGMRLFFSSNNNISSNDIHDNPEAGIHLYSSESNNISQNNVLSNGNYGVRLRFSSHYNKITQNNITSHTNGINLTQSSDNRIYGNLLWNNAYQAYDDESDNVWENIYPYGGNFWSDYNKTDINKGPNQDQIGGDGIGDEPYQEIGGETGAVDNYPLMTPPEQRNFLYLFSPNNNSVIPEGTILDFIVFWEDSVTVSYSVNSAPSIILESPEYDVSTIDWDDGIYTISIFAYDTGGNEMDASYTLTLDTSVPGVTHLSVADALYPYSFTRFTIYFTEPMNTQSVESALNIVPSLNYTTSWIDDDKTLTLENIEGLELYETYKINLRSGVEDKAGNIFTDFESYEFLATIDIDLDTDEDEIPDGWEFLYNLNPFDASDARIDLDEDGHSNLDEFQGGSNPIDPESVPLISKEGPSAILYWWLIPILVVLIILTIALFVLLLGERKEELKSPRKDLEGIYLQMRAEKDIKAMEAMLKNKKLGVNTQEGSHIVRKAKEAFEEGNYNVVILYGRTLKDLVGKENKGRSE